MEEKCKRTKSRDEGGAITGIQKQDGRRSGGGVHTRKYRDGGGSISHSQPKVGWKKKWRRSVTSKSRNGGGDQPQSAPPPESRNPEIKVAVWVSHQGVKCAC